ncbi:SGNH/GDSL hydrolase family protein [Mycetocola spongiae]|uniref:SGNH/GDSL hydrolase family protein n=1 Tax=Mycetocola spongiae TaxID=2859226 RepID=UPI001CF1C628|nr:SGNH/GDSL hydrolase family protein [Mycetocola spongiae]UCR89942.1 SGNH/GDSL hydrolase family protein [Mycetocola spongiae]
MFHSYVAIGDSFSEGMGDNLPGDRVRGWADLVALGLSLAAEEPVRYANLAIRGKKLDPIIDEQLDRAIALGPELMSINGGGNDIMRPRISIDHVADRLLGAVETARAAGIHVLLLSGANPSEQMPMGSLMSSRGDVLARKVMERAPREGVTVVDNWSDEGLRDARYWSVDRIHLNPQGHARVAANVLRGLGVAVPESWGVEAVAQAPAMPPARRDRAYYREHVLPWIGRRLTGRSSGDGRLPKYATLEPVSVLPPA